MNHNKDFYACFLLNRYPSATITTSRDKNITELVIILSFKVGVISDLVSDFLRNYWFVFCRPKLPICKYMYYVIIGYFK